jgi:hypothetical protein
MTTSALTSPRSYIPMGRPAIPTEHNPRERGQEGEPTTVSAICPETERMLRGRGLAEALYGPLNPRTSIREVL